MGPGREDVQALTSFSSSEELALSADSQSHAELSEPGFAGGLSTPGTERPDK